MQVCWPERLLSLVYDITEDALEVPRCIRLEEFADGDAGAWIGTASGDDGDAEPSILKIIEKSQIYIKYKTKNFNHILTYSQLFSSFEQSFNKGVVQSRQKWSSINC